MNNNVRKVRKKLGLSGEALARKAEMSASDLSKVERGRVYAFPGWRRRISDALGVPECELFPEEEQASA